MYEPDPRERMRIDAQQRRDRRRQMIGSANPYEVALRDHRQRVDAVFATSTVTLEGCRVIVKGPAYARRVLQRPKIDGVGPSPLLLSRLIAIAHGKASLDDPVVRHTCDNPACIEPDHLKGGTHADNSQDMTERGRMPDPKRLTGRPPKAVIAPDGRRYDSPEAAAKHAVGVRGWPVTADAVRKNCVRRSGGWHYE